MEGKVWGCADCILYLLCLRCCLSQLCIPCSPSVLLWAEPEAVWKLPGVLCLLSRAEVYLACFSLAFLTSPSSGRENMKLSGSSSLNNALQLPWISLFHPSTSQCCSLHAETVSPSPQEIGHPRKSFWYDKWAKDRGCRCLQVKNQEDIPTGSVHAGQFLMLLAHTLLLVEVAGALMSVSHWCL